MVGFENQAAPVLVEKLDPDALSGDFTFFVRLHLQRNIDGPFVFFRTKGSCGAVAFVGNGRSGRKISADGNGQFVRFHSRHQRAFQLCIGVLFRNVRLSLTRTQRKQRRRGD